MKFPSKQLLKKAAQGAALIIVLAFVVVLTGVALAYFSRTVTDRQLAQSSSNDTGAGVLARSALDIVVSDFKQELLSPLSQPITSTNIQPRESGTDASIPNLIRRSVYPDLISAPGVPSLASAVSSRPVNATNPKRGEVTSARWNSHYLIPPGTDLTASDLAPYWVLVTRSGPVSFAGWQDSLKDSSNANYVVGRYAFAVYDEGGLLDMNLAGYPNWTGTVAGNPTQPTPTPWPTNVGRKGILTFADLTALAPLSQTQVDNIVGWRNFATTQQTGTFGSSNFSSGNQRNRQNAYGSYLLDFGFPPFTDPTNFPFTIVDTSNSGGRTDQALMTRQELLKLWSSLNLNTSLLQYVGTFSRERNQPARDWGVASGHPLNGRLPDRYDITNLALVKPNPPGTPSCNGNGHGGSNGQGCYKGRGRFRGSAGDIRNQFGLAWVAPDLTVTDSHRLAYWGHWRYVGVPGLECPNTIACDHIPVLRGANNDFFMILDYALTQANVDSDDTANVADILSLGASLIDQYDNPPNSLDTDGDLDPDTSVPAARKTHVTIIQYGNTGQFVLGWETGEAVSATTNPYNPTTGIRYPDPITGTTKPTPTFIPITLDHAFTTVGELGYGLRPEFTTNRFQRLNFNGASTNGSILDFFSYNPVGHGYPRLGIVNLNTKNIPVLAAILQSALKKDVDVSPIPSCFPTISSTEATNAAQAIVSETWTNNRPALTRKDIGRLTGLAASAITTPACIAAGEETEKVPEAIARALAEVTQARSWNLMIDVIAQTGRYAPNAQALTDFTVQGEKRYWLHIALGRDLLNGQVDVLGTQLEEVVE
jgi:hypothetical protein